MTKKRPKANLFPDPEHGPYKVTCAHCGKEFEESDLGAWGRVINKDKPACSYECNKALGQAK